jgi:membrane fusion protein (multidrug efflux system)
MQFLRAKKDADRAAFASIARPLSTVAIEPASSEVWQQFLPAIGSFTAIQDVMVTNEIEGKVTAIHFTSGQHVEKGAVLVKLDTSVDVAQLQALAADERLNDLQFERSKRLVKENSISKSEFDIAAARRDEAAAMTRAKAASVRKKTILAPFGGILGIRAIDLGEYLDSGSKIVSLHSLSPIYLDFGTPERYISYISIDQQVFAEVHAYPGEVFEGRISAVEPGIDRATRNLLIRAEFANAEQRLRSGMFAEIKSTLTARDNVVTVPETAVAYTPYGNSVFVVVDDKGVQRAMRRQIETGQVRDGRVSVIQGITAGEHVVSAGHNKLRNGMEVTVEMSASLSPVTAVK